METAGEEVEILTRPISISEESAKERVENRLLTKAKGLYSDQKAIRAELRYKPFYEFETTLIKRYFFSENVVQTGAIIVDTLTGITRPILEGDINLTEKRVLASAIIEPEIDRDEAHTEANGRRMQIQHREKGDVKMNEEPRLVYKPVWLVEMVSGDVLVVNADDGQVISDVTLG